MKEQFAAPLKEWIINNIDQSTESKDTLTQTAKDTLEAIGLNELPDPISFKKPIKTKEWEEILTNTLRITATHMPCLWMGAFNKHTRINKAGHTINGNESSAPNTPTTPAEKAACLLQTGRKRHIGNALRYSNGTASPILVEKTLLFIPVKSEISLNKKIDTTDKYTQIKTEAWDLSCVKYTTKDTREYIVALTESLNELRTWGEDPTQQTELIKEAIKESKDNIILIIEEEL